MSQSVTIHKNWLPTALDEFRAISKPREYKDLIKCQSPKFPAFTAQYGRTALEAIFEEVVTDLSQGLGLPVSGTMVADSVDIIIDEYPEAKLSDLLLFKRLMLKGDIGGQVGDKLWKWNTRTICQAWGEYYDNSTEAIRAEIDRKHQENKDGGGETVQITGKEIPMPDYVKQNMDKLYRKSIAEKRILEEIEKPEPLRSKLTIDEIADVEGIDKTILAEAIRLRAEQIHKDQKQKIPLQTILIGELASIQFAARQNPKYLHELVKPKHD